MKYDAICTTKKIPLPTTHWKYFLSLEKDLIECSHYVEFSQDNYGTYSVELAKILMASAAEFEVVSKLLCKKISPKSPVRNIFEIQRVLTRNFPKMHNVIVDIPGHKIHLKPLTLWKKENTSPEWWQAYNKVKHERSENYFEANLRNTLHAMGGLFCMQLYALAHVGGTKIMDPEPKLFDMKWYDHMEPVTIQRIFSLPKDQH